MKSANRKLVSFTHADWLAKTNECLAHIEAKLKAKNYIVRSSCIHEDGTSASNAGAYLSVGDVVPDALEVTINNVFASYGKVNEIDQILIQPMLQNVIRSGVAFSHDPNTHSPYRVISWTEGRHYKCHRRIRWERLVSSCFRRCNASGLGVCCENA